MPKLKETIAATVQSWLNEPVTTTRRAVLITCGVAGALSFAVGLVIRFSVG